MSGSRNLNPKRNLMLRLLVTLDVTRNCKHELRREFQFKSWCLLNLSECHFRIERTSVNQEYFSLPLQLDRISLRYASVVALLR